MTKLLFVEDDKDLCYMIKCCLEDFIKGYEVIVANNGKEGFDAWKEHHPDVIVSDIEMPVMDGFEMVSRIREMDGNTPILFGSARISPKDVTDGYKLGINNYIKKPFIPDEIDAHVQAVLKLQEGNRFKKETAVYHFAGFTLEADHALLIYPDGQVRTLTCREAGILQMFCENPNEVIRREAILSRFWATENDFFSSRSFDVFLLKLRKLFEGYSQVELQTIRGVGIRFIINSDIDSETR